MQRFIGEAPTLRDHDALFDKALAKQEATALHDIRKCANFLNDIELCDILDAASAVHNEPTTQRIKSSSLIDVPFDLDGSNEVDSDIKLREESENPIPRINGALGPKSFEVIWDEEGIEDGEEDSLEDEKDVPQAATVEAPQKGATGGRGNINEASPELGSELHDEVNGVPPHAKAKESEV